MLDPTREVRQLKAGMFKVWTVWIAMFLTLVLALIFAFLLGGDVEQRHHPLHIRQITQVLYGVSIVGLILAYFIRKYMLHRASSKPLPEEASNAPGQISPYIARYKPAVVVSLAIAESVAAFGLTIFFMDGSLITFLIFLAIALVGLFLYRPKFEEVEKLAIAIKQSSET
ncbi:hypothetical protein F4X33_12340 [Candidatus Poribacteria bacterium]|nr:hypothetical protein [Candidatus Poribacteria bacterium]